jgi:hypothetical protein
MDKMKSALSQFFPIIMDDHDARWRRIPFNEGTIPDWKSAQQRR